MSARKVLGVTAATFSLLLASCSSNTSSSEETTSPLESIAPVTSNATPSSSSSVNARGNVEKSIGEDVNVTNSSGETLYSFRVNSIEADPVCTEEYAQSPENGHLVKLDIEAKTADAATFDENFSSGAPLGSSTWKYISSDGTTFNGDLISMATVSCLSEASTLPAYIGPAEQVTGSILLDVPALDGTVVYEDFISANGIEYNLAQ